MKPCNNCNEEKAFSEYYTNKALRDGHENVCKVCRIEQRRKHVNNCENCGTAFKSARKGTRFCSRECRPQSRRQRIEVSCFICKEKKGIVPSRAESYNHFYCSDKCQRKGYSLLYSGENHARYNSVTVECFVCTKEITRWESQVVRSERNYCSKDCQQIDYRERFSGEGNPGWDQDKPEEDRISNRNIEGYSEWRLDTFERDSFTCQCCGNDKGGNLVAHHILNYSNHPELRTCLSNSITLCDLCHKRFHDTYGYRDNNKRQLNEYIANIRQQVS